MGIRGCLHVGASRTFGVARFSCALMLMASVAAPCSAAVFFTPRSDYDEQMTEANAVDTNASGASLSSLALNDYAGFKLAIAEAFAAGNGGVVTFDRPNDSTADVVDQTFVARLDAGRSLDVTSTTDTGSQTMDFRGFTTLIPISGASAGPTAFSRGALPTDATVTAWRLTLAPIAGGAPGEMVSTVGFTVLSRDAKAQTLRIEVFAADLVTPFAVDDEVFSAGKGVDDTFFSFTAPVGEGISSIRFLFDRTNVITMDDRLAIDDFGVMFVPEPTAPALLLGILPVATVIPLRRRASANRRADRQS